MRSKAGVYRPVWRAPQGKGQSQEVGEKGEFAVSLYFVPLPRLTKVRGGLAFYHVKKYQDYINVSELKLPTSVGSWKKQESSRKTCTSALLTTPKPLTVCHNKFWKILKEMGIPDHLTCLLRNLYAGQEATVRIGHGTID